MINDTIIALASVPLKQAIAIIRISGPETFSLVNKVFSRNILNSSKEKYFGRIINPNTKAIIDEVVLVCYYNTNSFTGEDTIEINCHGSMLIVNKIIHLLLTIMKDDNIRLATPGEFTRKAFLNGKIDLLQAQAVNDLVNASNDEALALAMNSLNGNNSKLLKEIETRLLELIANIIVNIDYPEYDGVENLTQKLVLTRTNKLYNDLLTITKQSKIAQVINDGIDTVIIGKPNVGKSTLLNALLKENRAITSTIAGTTRDIVTGKINIDNISLNLIDTAGIRNTNDIIEQLGIQKSKQYLEKAQLILLVLDGSNVLDDNDMILLELVKDKNCIIVINKVDLQQKLSLSLLTLSSVPISALNNEFNPLIDKIKDMFLQEKINYHDNLILTSTYHQMLLDKITMTIDEAIQALNNNIPLDLVILHFQEAWDYLQEINGKIIKDNLLDEMFSRFCLGK
ncbi:tRNA uridine-5-carboxymethylaminomethyl(34) synthesis GTPase MnmE [Spiroplasma endosymbiont of Asaphidion curtum]|uniref:tRNA uridine-5-carboxymethylaminomethyl(34) synthesis GTPase MnmE n=1 Tax=Spiroplasma endosymbiont of Asaphidion curtum TaxID=3066281 RepID=UPI00313AD7EC